MILKSGLPLHILAFVLLLFTQVNSSAHSPQGTIGGTVYADTFPIANSYVMLQATIDGVPFVQYTKTDFTGKYLFSNLVDGTYTARVDGKTMPASYVSSSDSSTLVNDFTLSLTVLAGGHAGGDFYFKDPANSSIYGFVWIDENGDGVRNVDEPTVGGSGGASVRLTSPDGLLTQEHPVSPDGYYQFPNLKAGVYFVEIFDILDTTLTGYVLPSSTSFHSLSPGQQVARNFGFQDPETARLRGSVTAKGDPVRGAIVTLTEALTGALTLGKTDSNGHFDFPNLAAGLYDLSIDGELNLALTGLVRANASEWSTPIALGASASLDLNFQYIDPAISAIQGVAWYDADGDGTKDPGEPGFADVTLALFPASSAGEPVALQYQVTAVDGAYQFPALAAGDYRVRVVWTPFDLGQGLLIDRTAINVSLSVGNEFDLNFRIHDAGDFNGDGIVDGAEFNAVLGNFDEPAKLDTLNAAGYFTTDQVQGLNLGTPLLTKDPFSGYFTLTLAVKKSNNLSDYLPFSFTEANVNGEGKIELRFTSPDKAAFFRVEGQ